MAISAEGKQLWAYNTWDWVEGAPAVTDSQIYFASRSQSITALTPDGAVAWSENLNQPITASLVIGTNGVIYFPYLGHFTAIAPTNLPPPAASAWPMFRANPQHTGRVGSR
jgi:hypothetical protein